MLLLAGVLVWSSRWCCCRTTETNCCWLVLQSGVAAGWCCSLALLLLRLEYTSDNLCPF